MFTNGRFLSIVASFLLVSSAVVAGLTVLIVLAVLGSAFNVPPGLPAWVFWFIGIGGFAIALLLGASATLVLYCLGGGLRLLLQIERRLSEHISMR